MNVFSLQDRLFYENRILFGDNIHITVNTLGLFSLQILVNENIKSHQWTSSITVAAQHGS